MEESSKEINIHSIRNQNVLLDFELARLYDIETKVLNQAVNRNLSRFPNDFMFRLTQEEWAALMRSQFVTASMKKRNINTMPYAFTEHGVAMLSSVLRSKQAIKMNIVIIRTFIAMRRMLMNLKEFSEQLNTLKFKIEDHDELIAALYKSIEMLMEEKRAIKDWDERERIGFKRSS